MADEQSGNPPNQGTQQAQPAPQPPQPPPPPANAQEIIAAQQAALAKQIAEAQQRDRAQFGPAAGETAPPAPVLGGALARAAAGQQGAPQAPQPQPAPPQGYNLPQGLTPQQVAQGGFPGAQIQQPPQQPQFQGAPQQGLMGMPHPSVAQQGGMQPIDFSRLPDPSVPQTGVTIQQLAAGAQVQGGYAPQYGQQQQQQAQQQDAAKVRVLWYPARNSHLVIELDDSIIAGLPDDVKKETDPQAKVVAALLLEILSLRARVEQLEQGGMPAGPDPVLAERVYRLEQTLFEQREALKQGARAYREEQERLAMEELKKKQESGEG
jgi:hypothetical protein